MEPIPLATRTRMSGVQCTLFALHQRHLRHWVGRTYLGCYTVQWPREAPSGLAVLIMAGDEIEGSITRFVCRIQEPKRFHRVHS